MQNFTNKIKLLIEEDELSKAIKILDKLSANQGLIKYQDDITILSSRLKSLNREKRNEVISRSEYLISKAKINLAILELSKELEDDEIIESSTVENKGNKVKEKELVKDSVILREIDNKGKLTINYNKNTVRVIIIVILILTLGVYLTYSRLIGDSTERLGEEETIASKEFIYAYSEPNGFSLYKSFDFQTENIVVVEFEGEPPLEYSTTFKENENLIVIEMDNETITLNKIDKKRSK